MKSTLEWMMTCKFIMYGNESMLFAIMHTYHNLENNVHSCNLVEDLQDGLFRLNTYSDSYYSHLGYEGRNTE